MDFKFKKNAEPQGSSSGFWYDLTDGGYITPSEILDDPKQLEAIEDAITLLKQLEIAMGNKGLLNEF